jgi:hypothetical protein
VTSPLSVSSCTGTCLNNGVWSTELCGCLCDTGYYGRYHCQSVRVNVHLYYISVKWSLSRSVTFCPVLSIIGGQTAGPIGTKIGTNTHWDYAMKIWGVDDRECALMRALRAQTCVHHHISSICGQTAGHKIGLQIGTNFHWDNGQKLWGRRSRVRIDARAVHANTPKHSLEQWAKVLEVGMRVARNRDGPDT